MRELIHLITSTSKKIMRIHLKTEIPSQMQFGWKTETAKIKLCAAICFPLFVSPFFHLLCTSVLFSSLFVSWQHYVGMWELLSQECDYFVCIGSNGYAMEISMDQMEIQTRQK